MLSPPPTHAPFWDHPAFAVLVTGAVAIVVLIVNSILNTRMHREKLKADRDLAREKFDFDKIADERRVALERDLDQWRRRVTFAEQELTAFYEARSRLSAIRSPGAFGGEAEDREGREAEGPQLKRQRDIYYPVAKRVQENADFFNSFYTKRYLAIALLGPAAEEPYLQMWQALIQVRVAANMLLRWDAYADNEAAIKHRRQMEEVIWEGAADPDRLAEKIDQAVAEAEAILRPLIRAAPT